MNFLKAFYVNVKGDDIIILTLAGSLQKRNICFKYDKLPEMMTFFKKFKNRHKADVCVSRTMDLNTNGKKVCIKFCWSAYNNWFVDNYGNDISGLLSVINGDDVCNFTMPYGDMEFAILKRLKKLLV